MPRDLGRTPKLLRAAGLLLLCFFALAPAHARVDPPPPSVDPHHVDGSSIGGTLNLTANWLLKQGDDPRYADPKLDDRDWLVVTYGRPLSQYGLKHVDLVWYRTHVKVPANARHLMLSIEALGGSKQVFINGAEVSPPTVFPLGGNADTNATPEHYLIPDDLLTNGDITIAIRASIGRFSSAGENEGALLTSTRIFLGDANVIADQDSLYNFRGYSSNTANLVLELLLLLITVALALALRREREYLALAIYLFSDIAADGLVVWRFATDAHYTTALLCWTLILQVMVSIALLEFVRLVLGIRRSRWVAGYEWLIVIVSFTVGAYLVYQIYLSPSGASRGLLIFANISEQLTFLPLNVGLPLLALVIWWRRRNPDALLLFVPLFLQAVWLYVQFVYFILQQLHLVGQVSPQPPISGFYVQWVEISKFCFSVALLLFLVLRTIRIARSRAAVAAEIAAAQTMQQVLLARSSQATPGFTVENVYLPANELGGDFFLISPGADGSLVVVVGDVSGKGLIAAMRVSMILGVLRREDSRDPAEVLSRLNEALLAQSEMGFTTACCVRIDPGGRYSIANAGHLFPYIEGREVETPPALPLGLAPEQTYEVVEGSLTAGHIMVLISDGVVEARSAKGELLGFDRMPDLTRLPASEIAGAAQRFGQDDDITVLTIALAM